MSNNNTNRDVLSSAELGQPNASQDESTTPQETSALLGDRRRPSNAQNGKRFSGNGKRSLTDGARKKIIIALTSISGALLVILAFTLVHKIGAAPSTCLPCLVLFPLLASLLLCEAATHFFFFGNQLTDSVFHQL